MKLAIICRKRERTRNNGRKQQHPRQRRCYRQPCAWHHLWFFGYSALVSVILGIVGLILAGNAKKAGFNGGIRTAGFVLSLIGLIGGAIFFVACVACVGAIGAADATGAFDDLFSNM